MEPFLKLKSSGDHLMNFVLPLAKVAKQATVHYAPDGIYLIGLHPDKTVTVVLEISPSCFDFFSCEDSGIAGIDLKQLFRFVTVYGLGESTFILAGEEGKDNVVRFFIEHDGDLKKLEAYEYVVMLDIPSGVFRQVFFCGGNSKEIGNKSFSDSKFHLTLDESLVFITITGGEVGLLQKIPSLSLHKSAGNAEFPVLE